MIKEEQIEQVKTACVIMAFCNIIAIVGVLIVHGLHFGMVFCIMGLIFSGIGWKTYDNMLKDDTK
jgi:hypothetical protein